MDVEMKVQWVRTRTCYQCHEPFLTVESSICRKCGTIRGRIPVVTDIPAGTYLMKFCVCDRVSPIAIRDSAGHLHLKMASEVSNTIHAGEQ